MNTYIDVYDYLRAGTGQDTSSLVGNVAKLAQNISTGATLLPISPSLTVALQIGDLVTIFDGSNTEIVTITTAASIGDTSIHVSATQYAHALNVALCSDGTQGSLADRIIAASAEIENYCRQPLLQATYSNERLPLRTMRAAITRDYTLMLRPKQFPVQSVSSVILQLSNGITLGLDVSEAFIDADARLIQLLQLTSTSGGSTTFWGNTSPPAYPTTPGYVEVSYTAGYAYTSLPYDVKQACTWLTSDLLSDRMNPTGATMFRLGNLEIQAKSNSDRDSNSLLVKRAYQRLDPYRQRAF